MTTIVRNLVLVIIISAIVGGSAGWLGANFEWEWVVGNPMIGGVSESERRQYREAVKQRQEWSRQQELDRRLACIEAKATDDSGRILGPCW